MFELSRMARLGFTVGSNSTLELRLERISYDCENDTTRSRHDYGRNAECFYREHGIYTVTARRGPFHTHTKTSLVFVGTEWDYKKEARKRSIIMNHAVHGFLSASPGHRIGKTKHRTRACTVLLIIWKMLIYY